MAAYVWFVSVGYWTWWPKSTYTYDLLGSAFRSGQLSLQEAPDPALLALPNPYNPNARAGLQYPWDASLYNGKYYLYWGPTPALFLAFIKLFYSGQIPDQYLVFAFVLGTYVFGALLLLQLWRRVFGRELPIALVLFSLLALGLVGPATWLLNRPAGYEAAISGGQFLLMAGLFFGLSAALSDSTSNVKLLLAGSCWALAVGSRVSTMLPIGLLMLVMLVRLAQNSRPGSSVLGRAAAFLAPLVAGGAALAWYNWARFGSATEFGLRYQLTFIDLHAVYGQAFSFRYIPDNLYNYLLNPASAGRTFPFLTPLPPARLPTGPALSIPGSDLEPVTGLLISAPFLVYALLPVLSLFGTRGGTASPEAAPSSPRWLYLSLVGAALVAFGFILLYFFPTMRQLDDVAPLLSLLAVLGLWEGWRFIRSHPVALAIYSLVSLGLILVSVVISCLLAVTSYENRFQHLNRDVFRELVRFFGR